MANKVPLKILGRYVLCDEPGSESESSAGILLKTEDSVLTVHAVGADVDEVKAGDRVLATLGTEVRHGAKRFILLDMDAGDVIGIVND